MTWTWRGRVEGAGGGVKQEAHYSSQCEDFYTECGSAVSHVDSDVARLQRQGGSVPLWKEKKS